MASTLLQPLTKEQVEHRYFENGIIEEDLRKNIKILTQWYAQQPNLPKKFGHPAQMRIILVTYENNLELAKHKIESIFHYRMLYPDYFIPTPVDIYLQKKADFIFRLPIVLPKCTPDGCRVMMYRPEYDSVSNPTWDITTLAMLGEYVLKEDLTFAGGIIVLVDSKCVTFSMVVRLVCLMKFLRIVAHLLPIRIKKILLLNVGKLAKRGINMAKPLLKEELRNKIEIIPKGNIEKVYSEIPKDILPADYGGYEESHDEIREKYYQKLVDMQDWFRDNS